MPKDWVNPNTISDRERMDRRLEKAGLLNYQTEGLLPQELAARYAGAGISINGKSSWFKDNYGFDAPDVITDRQKMFEYRAQMQAGQAGGVNAVMPNLQIQNPRIIPAGGKADRPQNFMQGTDPLTGKLVSAQLPKTAQTQTNAQSPYAPMVFAKPEQVQKGEANWTDLSTTDRAAILKNPDFYKNNEILKYTPAQQQEILADTNLDWKQLPKWQQAFYSFSSNPYLMSTTQGAIMGVGGGIKGVVFGGVLGALGVASKYDPTKEFYKQGDENNKMDAGDFIRGAFGLLNFAAEQAEKGIGVVVRGAQIVTGNDPNFDPNKRNLDIQFNDKFNLDLQISKNKDILSSLFLPFIIAPGEKFNPELLTGSTWNAGASTFEAIAPSFTQMMAGDKTMQVSLLTPIVGIFDMFTNPEKYKGTEYYLGAAQAEQMQTTFYERLNEAEQRIKNGENYRQVALDMQTGIIAQLGDMVGQGVADPLNIAGEVQAAAGYGIAKITDNKIAAAAFADANGLMEAQARYKNIINTPGEALKIDPNYKVQELGALGKMVAGLNKDGQVKAGAFTQQGLLDYTAPKKNLRGAIEYLTNLNPESRARVGQDLLLSNVGRIMSSYFGGTDVEGFANWWKAFSQGDMTQAADLSNAMAQSPEFYTVLPAAKDFDIDAAVTKWKASDDARQSVTRIADILGENPTSMLEDMAKRGTSQQDFTRLQERLAQAGTPEAKALLKDIQQGKFTVDMLADTVKLFSSGDVPYHPAQWMAQTLNGIKDHYDNWAVQHFNLDAESKKTLFRVSSVLKSAQSVLLLGANPGYMISNVLPTMVTRAMSGVWGYMTPSAIDGTLTRMGFDPKQGFNPNRLDEGVGPGGMVDRTGGDPIREATRGKGILTKLENALGTIGRNMPFNKLSRLLEGYEGKQAGMIGMMKFWGEAWRRGKGFRELPRGLAQELAKIAGPRATEILYSAIEAGMNKQEILNIVSSAERNIQSRSLINEAAQKMNLPASKAASLLEQAGVFDALDNSLKNAKTDAQIDRAFERAKQTARVELDQQAARDAVANIEHIANRMNTEGMKAITDVILDTEDAGIEQWMQHYQRMGEAADAMDVIDNPNTRSSLWSLKYAESNAEFRRHNAHKGSVYLGVLKALGQDTNPTGRALLANMAGTDAALDTAYRTMRSLRDEHFAKWNNDWDNPRRQVERTNVERQIEKTWAEATKTELENSRQFGELLAQQYEQAFGIEAGEAARQAWEQISAFRKEMTDRRDTFRKTQESARDAGVPYAQRQMEAKKFWGETYKYMIVEMQRIKTEAIRKLDNIANQRPGDNQAPAPTEPTPPTTPPVTQAAQDFLNSATQDGAMPAFITNNLRKIASDNGITITDQMTAADVVQALQEKANSQPAETTQPTTPAPDELARLRQQAEERKAAKEAQTQAVWSAAEKYGFTQQEKHKLITSLNKYGDFEVLTYDDPRITPEYIDQTLQKRQEAKAQEQARKEQNAADSAVSQVLRDAIEKPRSEIPETISNALALEAQRIADVIMGGEPGRRLFARTGEFIGASASTYPKWYGELQATTGGRKSLLKALDKIVKDNGADKGVVVARVKEFLLGNLRHGDDATSMPPNLVVLKDLGADDTVLNFALDEFNTMMRTNFTMEQVLGNDYSSAFDGYYNDAMTPGAFDTDAWHVAVLEAADARDMAKLNDLYEQMPADGWDEIANASGDTYRQFYDERFEATSELIRTSQQEAAILDNQVRAEAAIREQQAEAELGFTRAKFRESLTEVFGLEETMADAVMDITDARANAYGDVNEWYRTRIADVQKAGEIDLAQEAFHGSPYKFDKFTTDRMGTGEGVQAYGWGLYFAGDKAVAEYYREVLSNDKVTYKGFESNQLSSLPDYPNYAANEVIAGLLRYPKDTIETVIKRVANQNADLREKILALNPSDFKRESGQLYKVDIPDEGYLLWDRPLSEQPEQFKKFMMQEYGDDYKRTWNDRTDGSTLHQMLSDKFQNPKSLSLAMKEAGLNGIKYLDGSSRSAGEGNYNYVVFDDQAIQILDTYYQMDNGNGDWKTTGAEYEKAAAEYEKAALETKVPTKNNNANNWRNKFNSETDYMRKASILRSMADASTSVDELMDIAKALRTFKPERNNIAWAVIKNPNATPEVIAVARYKPESNVTQPDGSGMLPGMNEPMGAGDQGVLFGMQPGAGGKMNKMDAGNARSVYDLDASKTATDTAGNVLTRGDIVETDGVRHNVAGVNMQGRVITTDGKLLDPASVTRVASQPDMFGSTPAAFSPKGGVQFLDDGRAIIRAFNGKADVSTIVHELGHIFRRDLQGADLRTVETWAGVKGGKWDVAAEEKFARGFERYLADGSAPTPKLRVVFEQFKGWMLNIYRAITGSPIDIDLTPQVKEVFDRLLIGQEQTRKIDTNEMLLQQGYDPKAYYQDPQGNIKRRGEINIKLDQSRRAQEADAILSSDFAKKLQEQKRTTPAGETKDPNVSPRKAPTHQLAYGEYVANAFAEQQKIAQNQLDTLAKIEAGELPQDAMPELMRDKLVKVKSDSGVTRYKSKPVTIEDVRAKYEEMLTRNTLSYEMYGDMREKWTAAVEQALKDDTPVSNAIKQEYYAMKKTSGERMQGAGQSANELFQEADPRMPLGGYEETAGWMPSSRAMDEVWSQDIAPLMDNMRDIAKQRLSEPTLDGAYRDMTPEAQRELMNYLKGVQSDMASTKMAASRWGEDRRDYAMLNYNKRTGFDQMLDVAFPYQFFYTRSMMTWAARAIDNPAILANYARIRRQQDRYENNLPERLRGKMRIEAPWMPDWMGDALYIDPLSVLFTPHSFMRPFEQMARDNNQQNVEAERILQEWAADGVVPENQIVEAAQTRSGKTWERALAEAKMRREAQIANPMDFVSATFGPAWYLTTPAKLLGLGKDGPETLTELPITRTARAVDTVTNNTWAEPIGNLIGLFAKPEEALRKKLNLPEFGEYGAYYVDRQLANMVAEGKITSEEATILMIERQGPRFDEARERVKMELAMRVPLMGATYAALNEGAGAGLKALPASLFGAAILPEGELKYRGLKQEWNDAWKLKDAGDDQAITRFFEEHPEYEAYLAKGKEPEERLKSFLVGQIWDGYMALGTTDRKQATAEMGKEFQQSFLDTETRSYDTLNIETLTQWAQMLNKRVPKTEQTLPAIENPRKINFLSSEVTSITDQYYEQRKRMYPDYYDLEQGYYNLPKSERRSYLVANPNLKEYWDWKQSWYDRYPDLVPVFKGEVFRQVDTSTWNPALVEFVADYAYSGAPLPAGAYKALTQVWINEGQPRGSLDDWLKQDVAPSLLYGN